MKTYRVHYEIGFSKGSILVFDMHSEAEAKDDARRCVAFTHNIPECAVLILSAEVVKV